MQYLYIYINIYICSVGAERSYFGEYNIKHIFIGTGRRVTMTYNSFLYLWRNARDVFEIKVPIIANGDGGASHRFVYYNNDIVYPYFIHIDQDPRTTDENYFAPTTRPVFLTVLYTHSEYIILLLLYRYTCIINEINKK